ncbi:MAG: hypothetical protein HYY52_02555 [Candidatus Melainabacteria bacterium]|nr:hypothetical protein [Candidatus Melainabacteria bacterium]
MKLDGTERKVVRELQANTRHVGEVASDETNTSLAELKKLILQLKQASSIDKAVQLLQTTPDIKELTALLYSYKGYFLLVGLKMHTDEVVEKLKYVNDLEINSAPRLIEYVELNDFESVIITNFQNCEAIPIPFEEHFKDKAQLPHDIKEQFLSDMEALVTNNVIHPCALSGPSSWLVNPQTGQILLWEWGRLEELQDSKKDETLQTIKEFLRLD